VPAEQFGRLDRGNAQQLARPLDAASYEALAKQSMNTPPFTFRAVDPGLFSRDRHNRKLPPGPGPQSGRPDRTVSPRTER